MAQPTHQMDLRSFDDTISFEVKIKYAVLVVGLFLTILFSYSYVHFSPPGLRRHKEYNLDSRRWSRADVVDLYGTKY
jgi:hypothetical protein